MAIVSGACDGVTSVGVVVGLHVGGGGLLPGARDVAIGWVSSSLIGGAQVGAKADNGAVGRRSPAGLGVGAVAGWLMAGLHAGAGGG